MLVDDLRRRLRRRPFVPFRVHLADGRVFDVQYPDINLLGETIFGIGIPEAGVPDPFAEDMEVVYVNDIRRLKPEEAPAEPAPAGNGQVAQGPPAVRAEELRRLLRREPFQPFRVHLADGQVFDIRHPHLQTVGETYLAIGVPESDDPDSIADHTVLVSLPEILRVELMEPAGA